MERIVNYAKMNDYNTLPGHRKNVVLFNNLDQQASYEAWVDGLVPVLERVKWRQYWSPLRGDICEINTMRSMLANQVNKLPALSTMLHIGSKKSFLDYPGSSAKCQTRMSEEEVLLSAMHLLGPKPDDMARRLAAGLSG